MNTWQSASPSASRPLRPAAPGVGVIDTALPSPNDLVAEETAPTFVFDSILPVDAFSLVVLISAP